MNGPEILIPLLLIIGVSVSLITYITSRHRERMAMVQKGLSSEEIKAYFARDIRSNPLSSLKWGLLFIFVGIAIVAGNFLRDYFRINDGAIFGLICLCAGCALLVFYVIAAKREYAQQ